MQKPPANWPSRFWPWATQADTDRTFPTAILAEPFPGAAPPFGSKDDDDEEGGKCSKCNNDPCTCDSAEASYYSWGTFALDALPDSLTDEPGESDDAVDHSEDGEARDTSVAAFDACLVGNALGFTRNAFRSVAGQQGTTSPVSKLPPAPQGASDRAKERQKAGRGIEGHEGVDPMSTMDKFNWDNLPLPGLGQI